MTTIHRSPKNVYCLYLFVFDYTALKELTKAHHTFDVVLECIGYQCRAEVLYSQFWCDIPWRMQAAVC